MKISKAFVITINVFLLSPFLSIPLLIAQLYKKVNTGIIFLTSLLISMLSMKFIPNYSNDKTRHIERNQLFTDYGSLSDLFDFFEYYDSADYLFSFFIYVFNRLNVNVKYFFFIVTFISVYLTLLAIKRIVDSTTQKDFSYTNSSFFLAITSISAIALLSGVRYFLAGSFFIWFIYFLFFDKKLINAYLVLTISVLIHFSYSLLLMASLIAFMVSSVRCVRIALITSLLFYLLPMSFLENILQSLSLPSGYLKKVQLYTEEEYGFSDNAVILNQIKNLWFYLAFGYLIFTKKISNENFYIIIAVYMTIINLMFPIPVVFNRYTGFYKIVFAAYLIYIYGCKDINKMLFLMFYILMFISFSIEIFVLRYNFIYSYPLDEMWSIFHIFSSDENLLNFLY